MSDSAARAPASDDDTQAEHQIQASLQRATEDVISLLDPEKYGHAMEGAKGGIGTSTLDALHSEVQSSMAAPASFPLKHSEQNGRFRHADTSESVTRVLNGVHFNVTQEEDDSRSRKRNAGATHVSSFSSTVKAGGTTQSSHGSDENLGTKGCSNSPHKTSRTVDEAPVDSPVASQNLLSWTVSPTVLTPWSTFPKSGLDSLTNITLSSVFSSGSRSSNKGRNEAEEAEKNDDPKCCPLLEIETLEKGQRGDRLELRQGDEDKTGVNETSQYAIRNGQDVSADSFVTATEAPNPDREERVDPTGEKPNEFFGRLHPSRMILISNREAPPQTEMLPESRCDGGLVTWKATGANTMPLSTRQEPGKIQKAMKKTKQITSNNTRMSQSESSSIRDCSKAQMRFLVEGIESLQKRYAYLHSTAIDSKEWSFALQEITAILRTPFSHQYISWQGGFSVQLKTDFKVFRFRGPFTKALGKGVITKKAVLYVIEGPFFFKQAVLALEKFCEDNRLTAPIYTYSRHPDGTFGCSVRVGNQSVFGNNDEGWVNKEYAKEDTAKTAMNALYREGVPMNIGAFPDAMPAWDDSHAEPQIPNKRKAPISLFWEEGRRTSCRVKEDIGPAAQHAEDPKSRIEYREVKTIKPDIKDGIQNIITGSVSGGTKSSIRTRQDLVKVLEGIVEPQESVMVICDYLLIQKPEYWMEGSSCSNKWFARFLSEHPSHKTGHTLIAPTVVSSLYGLQDCARRVEKKLLMLLYSGEMYLGDDGATFPDPAINPEWSRTHFANPSQSKKRRLEMDDSQPLEEINRRHYDSDNIALLPSTSSLPLGVVRKPALVDEDTGHESGDELPLDAKILTEPDDNGRLPSPSNLSAAPQRLQARHLATTSVSLAQADRSRFSSKQSSPANSAIARTQDAAKKYFVPKRLGSDRPANLLPSGEHRYVSPPPFLSTPTRLPRTRPATVKAEPQD